MKKFLKVFVHTLSVDNSAYALLIGIPYCKMKKLFQFLDMWLKWCYEFDKIIYREFFKSSGNSEKNIT
jgi:hypothetical protein